MKLTKEQKELIKGEDLVNDGEVEAFLRGYKKKFGKGCGDEIRYIGEDNFPICCGDENEFNEVELCKDCKKNVPKINLNAQER